MRREFLNQDRVQGVTEPVPATVLPIKASAKIAWSPLDGAAL